MSAIQDPRGGMSRGGMSVVELVATVRRRMETGALASEAVAAVFNPDIIARDALIELARYGAISLANNGEHWGRTQAAHAERTGTNGPTQAQKVTTLLKQLRHKGADGAMRSLWEFRIEDWRAFEDTARMQSRGWAARARIAKATVALMEKHGAATTHKLPTNLITELTAKVSEAW